MFRATQGSLALRRGSLLVLVLYLILGAYAAPKKLGIQRDYLNQATQKLHPTSYSGWIEFEVDKTGPNAHKQQPMIMSDRKFLKFAKRAWDEMKAIHDGNPEKINDMPGTMSALAHEQFVYFASSITISDPGQTPFTDAYWAHPQGIRQYLDSCVRLAGGTHASGGHCAEPNVLETFYRFNKRWPANDEFAGPLDAKPSIATWGRVAKTENAPMNFPPCSPEEATGWGCHKMVNDFSLKAVSKERPDPAGQDDWKFEIATRSRTTCILQDLKVFDPIYNPAPEPPEDPPEDPPEETQ